MTVIQVIVIVLWLVWVLAWSADRQEKYSVILYMIGLLLAAATCFSFNL